MDKHYETTRKVYESIHAKTAQDDVAFKRLCKNYERHSFGVPEEWFRGKEALDAGCGNIGAVIFRLTQLGVKKVYGIDLGSDWIDMLSQLNAERGISESQYELKPGSVLDIPFEDGRFDFVSISGVLVHLKDMTEIMRGFAEGARVCKPGGYYYTLYGPCGGIVEAVIFKALRQHYKENEEFRNFIDTLNSGVLHSAIEKICADAKKYTGESWDVNMAKSLLGNEFCLFLQNHIQAPTWLSNETTPELVEELYKAHGFTNITRLNNYILRNDIRKFLAPLHYDVNYSLSKLLYGRGYIHYVAQKASK